LDKRISWGYPSKSRIKLERKLARDLKFYGASGPGDCAYLEKRHPKIEEKVRRDGSTWYQIMVDDVELPLSEAIKDKWIRR